jgi:molybdenum cofactor guanylyltransferase
VLVEGQSVRHRIRDSLVKARNQETSDSSIDHNAGRGSDNVTRQGDSGAIVSETSAAILVGGLARRFEGRLKAALPVGGRTILERQITALGAAQINEVIVVGSWTLAPVSGVRHVPDVVEERSGLGGLYSALLMATTPIVVVLAGDMPFVQASLLSVLADVGSEADAVVPRVNGRWHPLCAGYRRTAAPIIKARLDRGDFRITEALNDLRVVDVPGGTIERMDPDGRLLMNLNTPGDYLRAQQRAHDHA